MNLISGPFHSCGKLQSLGFCEAPAAAHKSLPSVASRRQHIGLLTGSLGQDPCQAQLSCTASGIEGCTRKPTRAVALTKPVSQGCPYGTFVLSPRKGESETRAHFCKIMLLSITENISHDLGQILFLRHKYQVHPTSSIGRITHGEVSGLWSTSGGCPLCWCHSEVCTG